MGRTTAGIVAAIATVCVYRCASRATGVVDKYQYLAAAAAAARCVIENAVICVCAVSVDCSSTSDSTSADKNNSTASSAAGRNTNCRRACTIVSHARTATTTHKQTTG